MLKLIRDKGRYEIKGSLKINDSFGKNDFLERNDSFGKNDSIERNDPIGKIVSFGRNGFLKSRRAGVTAALLMTTATVIFPSVSFAEPGSDQQPSAPGLVICSQWDYLGSGEPEYKELFSGRYELALLDSESAVAFPELDKTLIDLSSDTIDGKTEYFSDMHEICTEAYDDGTGMFPMESEDSVYLRRSDDKVLSLLYYYYSYEGGAHGNYGYFGRNIDVKSGAELTLDMVFKDPEALPALIDSILKENYPDTQLISVADGIDEGTDASASLNWTLDPDGVTFYFNPYELASYADGVLLAFIPFKGNEELYTGTYLEQDGSWAMTVSEFLPLSFVKDDGSVHELKVWSDKDEYEGCSGFGIMLDSKKSEFDGIWFYSCDLYLVKLGSGRYYLYALCSTDNDYRFLHIYDLSSEPADLCEINGGFSADYERARELFNDDRFGSSRCAFNNPECFAIDTIVQYMSTVSGRRYYMPGEDGIPKPLTPYYEVVSERVLTLNTDLTLQAVDYPEDASIDDLSSEAAEPVLGEDVRLTKGEKLTLWRTDGESYMDLTREDGSHVRACIDKSQGWPQTIDGIDIMEAFDGIMFAG